MSDFPQAHTTHTHTTTTTTTVTTGRAHLDVSYIKTVPGILRIVEIVSKPFFSYFSSCSFVF